MAPITSNITRVFPFQVLRLASLTGIHVDSKAQAEQGRSVSVGRLGPVLGQRPASIIEELNQALRLHLQLQAGFLPRRPAERGEQSPAPARQDRWPGMRR